VPTEIVSDLRAAGMLSDLNFGTNDAQVQWVGELDWVYRTKFDLAGLSRGQKVALVFDGLDTFADVYLNGNLILQSKVLSSPSDPSDQEYVPGTPRGCDLTSPLREYPRSPIPLHTASLSSRSG
jgi:beta-galactosidase/beta-glucuronidase